MKDVLGPADRGLEDILALEPVRYRYKENNARALPSDQDHVGFVAQDIMKVYPETVSVGDDGYYNFDMHAVNVSLVTAVQELKAELDDLRAQHANEIDWLKARIHALENKGDLPEASHGVLE